MSTTHTDLIGQKAYFSIKVRGEVDGQTKWVSEIIVGEIRAVGLQIEQSGKGVDAEFYYLLELAGGDTVTKKHSKCTRIK